MDFFSLASKLPKGGITAGATVALAAGAFGQNDYNVKFKMELKNLSNLQLEVHQGKINAGIVCQPPTSVLPGKEEALAGNKTGGGATGCSGTVAWKISGTGKMLVVMYSLPYSHDFHSNWIGVGIFHEGDTSGHYQKMYYEYETSFKRKDFYYDTNPVEYGDDQFTVRATCGSSHRSEIKVAFAPNQEAELAASIKELLG